MERVNNKVSREACNKNVSVYKVRETLCALSNAAPTRSLLMSAWYLNMTCCLVRAVIWDQDLKASLHESTAACISAWVAFGQRVITSFVAYIERDRKR